MMAFEKHPNDGFVPVDKVPPGVKLTVSLDQLERAFVQGVRPFIIHEGEGIVYFGFGPEGLTVVVENES